LDDFTRIGRKSPVLADLKPSGKYVMAELVKIGGLTPLMKRLLDRGLLRPGMKADIAIFDPARVRDAATFERPHQYAEGISAVIVNGQVVFERGAMTAARPGKVLYKRQ